MSVLTLAISPGVFISRSPKPRQHKPEDLEQVKSYLGCGIGETLMVRQCWDGKEPLTGQECRSSMGRISMSDEEPEIRVYTRKAEVV